MASPDKEVFCGEISERLLRGSSHAGWPEPGLELWQRRHAWAGLCRQSLGWSSAAAAGTKQSSAHGTQSSRVLEMIAKRLSFLSGDSPPGPVLNPPSRAPGGSGAFLPIFTELAALSERKGYHLVSPCLLHTLPV